MFVSAEPLAPVFRRWQVMPGDVFDVERGERLRDRDEARVTRGMTDSAAFSALTRVSMHHNVKVRDVAHAILTIVATDAEVTNLAAAAAAIAVTLVLVYQESGAPTIVWIVLLLLLAILRIGRGRFGQFARLSYSAHMKCKR